MNATKFIRCLRRAEYQYSFSSRRNIIFVLAATFFLCFFKNMALSQTTYYDFATSYDVTFSGATIDTATWYSVPIGYQNLEPFVFTNGLPAWVHVDTNTFSQISIDANVLPDAITSSRSTTVQVLTNHYYYNGTSYVTNSGYCSITINQSGLDNTYSFSPPYLTLANAGDEQPVEIVAAANYSLFSNSNVAPPTSFSCSANWVTLEGTGGYPTAFAVMVPSYTPPNSFTYTPARTATIQIDNHVYSVTQAGYIPTNNGFEAFKQNGCGCNGGFVGDPISVGSGNLYEEVTDYTSSGDNLLQFKRYYNSAFNSTSLASSLGHGWRSTFDRYLRINSTNVIAERADGQELTFKLTGTNWTTDTDVAERLGQAGSAWFLTNLDGTVETYSSSASGSASLVAIQTRNGYVQTVHYDGNSHIQSVVDSFGRSLSFTTQYGVISTLTAPNGLVITYNINTAAPLGFPVGLLTSVSYSTTPQTSQSYLYENANYPYALTGIIDESGNRSSTWQYDAYGRAASSQGPNGANLTMLGYNADGSTSATNALGLVTVYKFSTLQGIRKVTEIDRLATANVPAAKMTFAYDTNGYCSAISDWNTNKNTASNDYRGLPLVASEAVGTAQSRITTNVFLTNYPLPAHITGPRDTSDFIYDTNGNMLSRTDSDRSTNTTPYSTAGHTRTWTNTFDGFGHLLTTTGPRTDVTATFTNTYDPSNNLISISDPLGHVTRFTNYTGSGLPLTKIDPNGVVTTFSYDTRDRLLSRTVQGSSGNATTLFTYDLTGFLTRVTAPDGSFLNYTYDAAHRLTAVSNALGERIDYTLDAAGNITNGTIRSSASIVTKTQNRLFDQLGRLLQRIGAASQTTTYGYDSDDNLTSIKDALTNSTIRAFDALNRLVSSIDPIKNTNKYAYDSQDNFVGFTDPRKLLTTNIYDGFQRIIQETSPDRGQTIYKLDNAGNRTNETDARGVVTQRIFDKLNRVTSVIFPASAGENITYTYDATNGGNFGIGRLTGYTDETGNTTLTYNERGDVISSTFTIAGNAYTTAYGYDLADHVTSIAYPSGHIITYGRDSQGRISSVSFRPASSGSTTPLASGVTYLPFGPLTGFTYGNGLTRSQFYDLDYRLTNITTSGSIAVQNLTFAYDGVNDIKAITDNIAKPYSQTFAYDQDYRLTQAFGIYGSNTYTYDGDGNRLTRKAGGITETNAYATNSNRLLSNFKSGITRSFSYLPNGNLMTDNRGTSTNYTYTYANRNRYKTLAIGGLLTATYYYNALGERLFKNVNGTFTQYHYDESGHLIAESQGNGTGFQEYVWLDDMPLAQIEGSGAIYYIHPDHLNRPQKMTDANQNVVWDNEQQPFGEAIPFTVALLGYNPGRQFQMTVGGALNYNYIVQASTNLGKSNWVSLTTNAGPFTFTDTNTSEFAARFYRVAYVPNGGVVTQNLRFPGQYYDSESVLNYNLMRDYDPTLGRYIQVDMVGLHGGINPFIYAMANSIRFADISGQITMAPPWEGPGSGLGESLLEGSSIDPLLWIPVAVGGAYMYQDYERNKQCFNNDESNNADNTSDGDGSKPSPPPDSVSGTNTDNTGTSISLGNLPWGRRVRIPDKSKGRGR